MSELPTQVVRQGGVEYGAFPAEGQVIELGWRFAKVNGAWRLAGYLVADGKFYRCLTWDHKDIGPADTIKNGMWAVISWNTPASAEPAA